MQQDRAKILIADDSPSMRSMYRNILKEDKYELFIKEDGREAVDSFSDIDPDLILLDVEMPVLNGINACEEIRKKMGANFTPIFIVTSRNDKNTISEIFKAGASDYLNKPFHIVELIARINTHVRIKRMHMEQKKTEKVLLESNKNLEQKIKDRTRTIEKTQEGLLTGLAKLAESRDPTTGAHIERTRAICMALSIAASMDERFSEQITSDFIENIYKSAPLHDIGKVGIPDYILNKPGKLTEEEYEQMKEHPIIGGKAIEEVEKLLEEDSFLETARNVAYYHHEKYGGGGYPAKKTGKKIPLEARIMAVADIYDAAVSKRPYKPSYSHKKALSILEKEKGECLDPNLVEIFLKIEKEIEEIGEKREGGDGLENA